MKSIIIIITMLFLGYVQLYGVDTKRDIKGAEKLINKADKLLEKNYLPLYSQALELYLEAIKLDTKNAMLNFKIGACYISSIEKSKALPYFLKALELDPQVNDETYFLVGKIYHLNYKFDKAISYYNKYKAILTPIELTNKKVLRIISEAIRGYKPFELSEEVEIKNIVKIIEKRVYECESGKKFFENPVEAIVTNVSSRLNSSYPDYVPVISADESVMYFTSRKSTTTGGKRDKFDGNFFEDIYVSHRHQRQWSEPKNLGPPINTESHDAAVGLSHDGQILYIFKDENRGDIFECNLQGTEWSKPRSMKEINSKYKEGSAAISADGKKFFFTSNREGTYGGMDIYICGLMENGKWGEPTNMGPNINTEYDEDGVFFHPNGKTLYFSSTGHNSMGEYDIFKADFIGDTMWTKPVNLGYPINTTGDDIFYVLSASGLHGYYSSSRKGGSGEKDIYMITMPQEMSIKGKDIERDPVNPLTLVKGIIVDAVTQVPIEADIEVTNNSMIKVISKLKSNSKTGKYIIALPSGKNYGISVKKAGYLFHSENFNIDPSTDYREVVIKIELKKLEVGSKVVLKNCFFDFGNAVLTVESVAELNRLITLLREVPEMKIEVSGHTDDKGSAEFNKELSTKRAQAVVDFLVEYGIDRSRLTAVGYGEEKPVTLNTNIDGSDNPDGRQINRRVEFEIIEN